MWASYRAQSLDIAPVAVRNLLIFSETAFKTGILYPLNKMYPRQPFGQNIKYLHGKEPLRHPWIGADQSQEHVHQILLLLGRRSLCFPDIWLYTLDEQWLGGVFHEAFLSQT
jgi:hypothetical protein